MQNNFVSISKDLNFFKKSAFILSGLSIAFNEKNSSTKYFIVYKFSTFDRFFPKPANISIILLFEGKQLIMFFIALASTNWSKFFGGYSH